MVNGTEYKSSAPKALQKILAEMLISFPRYATGGTMMPGDKTVSGEGMTAMYSLNSSLHMDYLPHLKAHEEGKRGYKEPPEFPTLYLIFDTETGTLCTRPNFATPKPGWYMIAKITLTPCNLDGIIRFPEWVPEEFQAAFRKGWCGAQKVVKDFVA